MDPRSLALILLVTTLAGCLGGGGDGADAASTPTATQTTAPPSTTTSTPSPSSASTPEPENRAPTVQLSTDAATRVLGEPFTFTLDASDADGDDLLWSFDADDDGSEEAAGDQDDLPLDVGHTYASVGEHTATFTVSDGEESVEASVTVTVTEVPFEDFTVKFEGTATGLALYDPLEESWTWVEGAPIPHTFEVPTGAGRITGALSWSEQGVNFDMVLYDPAGNAVAEGDAENFVAQTPLTPGPGEAFVYDPGKTLAAGTWTLEIWPVEAYEASYTASLDVLEDLAPVQRVFGGIAPVAPTEDASACWATGSLTSSHILASILRDRPYAVDLEGAYAVFTNEASESQVMEASGTVPGDAWYVTICVTPPTPPGEYTLTIG